MVFCSNIFLFLFLPVFLALYYLTPFRYKSALILVASYSFYAWWRLDFLLLFFAVTLWNFLVGVRIGRAGARSPAAKRWVSLGVTADLMTLGYFKYADFGVGSLNAVLVSVGATPLPLADVLLPIGISFYIFHAISYITDVYRGDAEPSRRFSDFAAFIALFPQLVAGPVLRYKDLASQFAERSHTLDKFTEGAARFMLGFVKKVFIADSIAPLADNAFALTDPTAADAWTGVFGYAAQLYFDFSGYSDMAVGIGLMMGFRFIENFNQPYISRSITEFWRRWHISLSTWLRDYLYIPLGGNRGGTAATYRNLFLTMLLGGLWHGANWTFVLWGMWHGGWLCLERAFGPVKTGNTGFRFLPWLSTLFIVLMGWVAFRAETLAQAFGFYRALFGGNFHFSPAYTDSISRLQLCTLALAWIIVVLYGLRALQARPWQGGGAVYAGGYATNGIAPLAMPVLAVLFALSVLKLSTQSYTPFLYFQF
jgi:alginate O-acetyltransferase complex protein AlgI